MLEITRNLRENLQGNPLLADYMGLQGISVENSNSLMKSLLLQDILRIKGMDEAQFSEGYENFVLEQENGLHHAVDNREYMLYGRIPCVVQLPIQDMLDEKKEDCGYNIALAEFGSEWLDEAFSIKEPPVLMGTGIEGLVSDNRIMTGQYTVADYSLPYNRDFIGMEDPKGIFRIVTAIPLVMVVDTRQAKERIIPHSMAELLSSEYENSIVYPDDGHMLDSIMLTYFYQTSGFEGVRAFKRNTILGAHPSQMIKPGGLERKPFIMLMPWIFASIKAKEEGMQLIWPEDGAPILPLVMTKRKDCTSKEKELFYFLADTDTGSVFLTQGYFPASCVGVDNQLPGKLRFIGWDFLYKRDLVSIIKECRRIVEE